MAGDESHYADTREPKVALAYVFALGISPGLDARAAPFLRS